MHFSTDFCPQNTTKLMLSDSVSSEISQPENSAGFRQFCGIVNKFSDKPLAGERAQKPKTKTHTTEYQCSWVTPLGPRPHNSLDNLFRLVSLRYKTRPYAKNR